VKFDNIPAFEGDNINVIAETPLGSRFKYAYDPLLDVMKMKHLLPKGYFFAFNFGFIPNTQAEDGDPIYVSFILMKYVLVARYWNAGFPARYWQAKRKMVRRYEMIELSQFLQE
jgi:inorganic pyrophosphatase